MSVLELRGVVALLGRYPALAGIDLRVDPREVVLLRGPNGAGKSTLLRLCAGLVRPDAGAATVLGHDLFDARSRRALRRRVGLLGHATFLYDDLTVVENVRFWARAAGATDRDADAAIERLEIEPRLRDLAVARLSAGQRRRTSIAAVVARRPELWLLDEPHAGLDQSGRDVIDRLVGDAASAGATVLVASHELERAHRIAPRTVTIAGGVVHDDTAGVTAAAAAATATAAAAGPRDGGPW